MVNMDTCCWAKCYMGAHHVECDICTISDAYGLRHSYCVRVPGSIHLSIALSLQVMDYMTIEIRSLPPLQSVHVDIGFREQWWTGEGECGEEKMGWKAKYK